MDDRTSSRAFQYSAAALMLSLGFAVIRSNWVSVDEVRQITAERAELQDDRAELQDDRIDYLKDQIVALRSEIAAVRSEVAVLKAWYNSHDQRIKKLEEK